MAPCRPAPRRIECSPCTSRGRTGRQGRAWPYPGRQPRRPPPSRREPDGPRPRDQGPVAPVGVEPAEPGRGRELSGACPLLALDVRDCVRPEFLRLLAHALEQLRKGCARRHARLEEGDRLVRTLRCFLEGFNALARRELGVLLHEHGPSVQGWLGGTARGKKE